MVTMLKSFCLHHHCHIGIQLRLSELRRMWVLSLDFRMLVNLYPRFLSMNLKQLPLKLNNRQGDLFNTKALNMRTRLMPQLCWHREPMDLLRDHLMMVTSHGSINLLKSFGSILTMKFWMDPLCFMCRRGILIINGIHVVGNLALYAWIMPSLPGWLISASLGEIAWIPVSPFPSGW